MENTQEKVEATTTKNQVAPKEEIVLRNNKISSSELIYLLKQTFPSLTKNEYMFALSQCKAYGLDPRKKEIYFVPFNGKQGQTIASITSYEVYANELANAGYYIINDWKGDENEDKTSIMIKSKVYDRKSGNNIVYQTPWISIKEYAKMDYSKKKLIGMWLQFPTLMLEKCVLVRVCRFLLGKNMGYTAEELYNAKPYKIDDQVVNEMSKNQEYNNQDGISVEPFELPRKEEKNV